MKTTPLIYTPGTVTGGGEVGLYKSGARATFCFTIHYNKFSFGPQDGLIYQDHMTGLRLASTGFDVLVVENNHAWFTGTGVIKDGQAVKFTVEIFTSPDIFYIYIPELDKYEAGGALAAGSVTIYN